MNARRALPWWALGLVATAAMASVPGTRVIVGENDPCPPGYRHAWLIGNFYHCVPDRPQPSTPIPTEPQRPVRPVPQPCPIPY